MASTPRGIVLKRVYEPPDAADGTRILVDRLWPRGLSKAAAPVDVWAKEIAPSAELRRWFSHDRSRWEEFRERYFRELDDRPAEVRVLTERLHDSRSTLLYAARDSECNNAVALRDYLSERVTGQR
jgi:uncharacterized protein YeaO (DUF488 family)